MKTVLLILLTSNVGFASGLDLKKAEEFQYVHCQSEVRRGQSRHFVFDIRAEKHAYYMQNGAKALKAVDLTRLVLQDSSLLSKPDSDDDVTWLSKKTGQRFKLYISDNAGYLMKGSLIQNGFKTPISCSDVTQEK